ncbi:MAG: HD family phosphohydrolase, partial [Minisyncoccia bacterium]
MPKLYFLRKKSYRYLFFLCGLILIVGTSLILVYQKSWGKINLKKGDIVGEVIKSPKTITFKSEIKTRELKEKAAREVPKIYRLDSKVINEQEEKINNLNEELDKIRKSDIEREEKLKKIQEIKEPKLSLEEAKFILDLNEQSWETVKKNVGAILLEMQKNEKIKYEELENFKNQISLKVNQSLSNEEKRVIIFLSQKLIAPNTFLDEVETNRRIEAAKEEVPPVYYTIEKDQIILKPGDRVNDFDLEKLEALGLTTISFWNYKTLGIILLIIILSSLVLIYLNYFLESEISLEKITFIFTIFLLVTLFLARLALPLKPIIAYLFPLAAPVIILALIINFEFGLFAGFIFTIFFSLVNQGSFELVIIQGLSILAGLLVVKNYQKPNFFLKIAVFLALINFLSALSFNLMVENFSLRTALILLITGGLYGLINAVIIAGFMTFLSNLLGITSFWQLSELANPESPLLKELSLRAPGTYHHSILVSNLAEAGAKACGGNPLLARVGAYYHDIGKLERPLFYIENQEGILNLHENLNPQQSVSNIINHVSAGLKIAENYHLPSEIKKIIAEHHGTT